MKQLTIAIPTYNRNSTLLANIQILLPQLTPACKLLIVDNCSDVPVADTLQGILARYPQLDYQIVRNRINIGANANIMRCMETCDTEWIWMLSDDDKVHTDAIERILKLMASRPECVYLNFSFDGVRQQSFTTRGIEDFVEKLDYSSNLPWISSSVYRASAMLSNLRFGYLYAYSLLPHVVTLLVTVGESGVCYWSDEQLINVEEASTPVEQQWSMINLALGHPVVFDLPLPAHVRAELARKLLVTNRGESISFQMVVYQLLLMSIKQRDPQGALYFYDQICHRGYYFDSRIKRRAEIFYYRIMLRFPNLVRLTYKMLKGKEFGWYDKYPERYGRA